MKKQQLKPASFAKKLSSAEMKKVQGGWLTTGLWVCTADGYECYRYKSQCQAACSNPASCRNYMYCP
jgi:hypothetical protein